MLNKRSILGLSLLVLGACAGGARGAQTEVAAAHKTVVFGRDIRPLLADRCFACHGFDEKKRQSGLRLDLKEGAFGELPKHKGKRAFVPGKPEESYAYQRIMSEDPQEMMPPPTARHLKMNAEEKELIREWIVQGAKWQDHWAFVKPVRPAVPKIDPAMRQATGWGENPIDAFVLAKLQENGLKPSPEADKATLIRRVSLDLTGLPPTVAEVDAFVKDTAPDAYERLVDRLLASPHYGEQMARHWLDEARYADSHGFQSDPERHQWHWRDWVIDAFNRNMPYDQFVTWQLAGDLLPNPTEEMKVATGFNRNHRMNSEGGVIDEEWHVETVIDRVETTSGALLGLTMGCGRCHDHKYDPISQREFYSFYAYFNSINEKGEYFSVGLDKGINGGPLMKCLSPDTKKHVAELNQTIKRSDEQVAKLREKLPEMEARFVSEGGKVKEPGELALRFALDGKIEGADGVGKAVAAKVEKVGGATTQPVFVEGKIPGTKAIKFDGSGAAVDAGPKAVEFERTDAFSFGAWVNLQSGEGSVLNKMNDGPGFRGFDLFLQQGGKVAPHFVSSWPQNALKVVSVNAVPMNQWVHVFVTYDGSSKPEGVRIYFNGQQQGTTVEQNSLHAVPGEVVKSKVTGSIHSGAPLLIGRRVKGSEMKGSVQDVRFYKRVLTPVEVVALGVGPDMERLVKIPAAKRTKEEKEQLAMALMGPLPEYAKAIEDKGRAQAELTGIDNDPANTTMIMEELPKPRETHILIRGQYDKPGAKVEPGVPAAISATMSKEVVEGATHPANRLGLARWIASPENPLTARVRVNRLWEKFFGVGIVKTSENFGTQAEWPSHPELLDWLATEFVAKGWDVKAIQKEIVMSAAYRQASNVTPELEERDPENRLIARGPRFRLAAEEVRDQALAVSGLLVDKIGGKSVKPYEPADLWEGNLFGNLAKYEEGKGDDLYRRTLYTFLKRTAAPANMMVWDMPSREFCVVKRSRTNTPLQALDVMNDPTYVEAARVLAERAMKEGGATAEERVRWAFKRATCREPSSEETKVLVGALERQEEHYKKDVAGAGKLVAIGARGVDGSLDKSELAAYTMTASVILNLDEVITRN